MELSRPPTRLGRINMLKEQACWLQPQSELFVSLHQYNSHFAMWQEALGLSDQEALSVYASSIRGEPLGSFACCSLEAFRGSLDLSELKAELLQKASRIVEFNSDGLSFLPRPQGEQPHPAPTHNQARQFITPPRLRPGEAAVLLAKGICLRCRKPGHTSDACPEFSTPQRSLAPPCQDHRVPTTLPPKQAPQHSLAASHHPQVRKLVSLPVQQQLPSPPDPLSSYSAGFTFSCEATTGSISNGSRSHPGQLSFES